MTQSERLQAPIVANDDLPGIGGLLGPDPEDFVVDEVPLYQASGSGQHLYVRARKRGLTTPALVDALARAAGVAAKDVGYAGLKDKHAVTSQWLSLPSREARPVDSWHLPEGIEVLEHSFHANKLRTGHLSKNRFIVRLVGVDADALPKAQTIARRLQSKGLLNYFGAQRFGYMGNNLAEALHTFGDTASRGRARRRGHFKLKLMCSVLQAAVFNRYLTLRYELGLAGLLQGEVVRLSGSNSMFVVDDPETEAPRYLERDLIPTGPIFGPQCRAALGRAAELEVEAMSSLAIAEKLQAATSRYGRGTRRDLLVWPEELSVSQPREGELVLSFQLESGAYATQLIREFTRSEFFELRDRGRGLENPVRESHSLI